VSGLLGQPLLPRSRSLFHLQGASKADPQTGPSTLTASSRRNPHKGGRAGLGCRTWSRSSGARRNLHLERRALPYDRLHPDAAAVHLHDLFGDGEP
jgi:hypothetical protein